MPYRFEENHPKCEAGEVGLVQDETEEFFGCHPSKQSARQQIQAIEASKGIMDSLLVTPVFGELKDMNDKGKFGGKLIIFGSKNKHDFERDYFDVKTDYWLDGREGKSAVLYDHGQDQHIGKTRLDDGGAELVVKEDSGVFLQTQLQRRNKYEEAVQELAKRGKMGLSSGTATHLVERERAGKNKQGKIVTHIKQWPLGLDASLTPSPAEPRTNIEPVENTSGKSIKRYLEENGASAEPEHDTVQVMGWSEKEKKAVSFSERENTIRGDFREQFDRDDFDGAVRIRHFFENFIIVKLNGKYFRVPYNGSVQTGHEFASKDEWTEVVKDQQFRARETAEKILKDIEEINEKFGDHDGTSKGEPENIGEIEDELDSLIEQLS